jgi:[acyl-carrier-protein] S-malonyltransferase
MAAVLGLSAEAVSDAAAGAGAAGRVSLANYNSPAQIVISGDRDAVALASELALAAGAKRVVKLNVSGAWHSELMLPARERFAPFVERTAFALPAITVISNVDAEPYRDIATIRTNLVRSVTEEVRWHATAERLVGEGLDLIVEFGASAVLAPLMKRVANAPRTMHVGDERGLASLLTQSAEKAPA